MSSGDESLERIRRLERRVARERAARQEAETIAERLTTDRWDQRQMLQERLEARTLELQAARDAATDAASDRERVLSELSHSLRTSLSALFFELESLSADEPMGERRLAAMAQALAEMRDPRDERALDAAVPDRRAPRGEPAPSATGRRQVASLSSVLEEHEERWQLAAAQAGKLLMVDLAPGSADLATPDPEALDSTVMDAITDLSESDDAVLELRLARSESGGVAVELSAG